MSLYTEDTGRAKGFDYTVTTGPDNELVTSTEVIDRMDLTDNEDEQIIVDQITAVRAHLEKVLNMTLVESKTITAYWQSYPERLELPFPPVTSVTSVTKVYRTSGTETDLTVSDDYWVEGVKNKIIHFKSVQKDYGVKVVYVTGLTEEGIVTLVKDAILSEVVEWYLQRGNPEEDNYMIGQTAGKKLRTLKQW